MPEKKRKNISRVALTWRLTSPLIAPSRRLLITRQTGEMKKDFFFLLLRHDGKVFASNGKENF